MPDQIVKTPIAARGASKEGVGRYVLVISTALVIVFFVIAWVVARYVI